MDDANNDEHQHDATELRAVATALEGELERLKENLETHRLLEHPEQQSIVRQLIRDIDEREDRLHELNILIASSDPDQNSDLDPDSASPTMH